MFNRWVNWEYLNWEYKQVDRSQINKHKNENFLQILSRRICNVIFIAMRNVYSAE